MRILHFYKQISAKRRQITEEKTSDHLQEIIKYARIFAVCSVVLFKRPCPLWGQHAGCHIYSTVSFHFHFDCVFCSLISFSIVTGRQFLWNAFIPCRGISLLLQPPKKIWFNCVALISRPKSDLPLSFWGFGYKVSSATLFWTIEWCNNTFIKDKKSPLN